jgi:hypothetical protein
MLPPEMIRDHPSARAISGAGIPRAHVRTHRPRVQRLCALGAAARATQATCITTVERLKEMK